MEPCLLQGSVLVLLCLETMLRQRTIRGEGGSQGEAGARPYEPKGASPCRPPCKPATHSREGRRPPPGAPLPALLRGSPEHAFPAGRVAGRGCDPHVRPGGMWLLYVQGVGGRWWWWWQFPFSQFTPKFYFLKYPFSTGCVSESDQSRPQTLFPPPP